MKPYSPALVAVILLATALYRRLRGQKSARISLADVLAGIAAGLGVSFLAQLAAALHDACLSVGDITCIIQSLDVHWQVRMEHRGWVGAQMALALPFAGLSPSRWGLCLLAVHVVNVGLVFALARRVGLARPWSVIAALLFFAVPGLANASFCPSNLTEFLLLTAFLLVTVAYLSRARAPTDSEAALWLIVEVGAVVLGVGNKESFIIYPALLVACEVTLEPGSRSSSWRARARTLGLRWLPHILLLPYVLINTLPWLPPWDMRGLVLDFSVGSILRQWARLAAAVAMPWLPGRPDPQSTPWAALLVPAALALLAKRCGPAMRFLMLFALIVSMPVGVLAKFDEPYAYHVWPPLAVGAVVALSTVRAVWLTWAGCIWLVLLGVPWDNGPYKTPCAASAAMVVAVQGMPSEICSRQSTEWLVPRRLAADHMAHWSKRVWGPSRIFAEARRCYADDGLDEVQRWRCLGGDISEDASMSEEAASPIGILRQLLAVRCGRRDVRIRLEPASGFDP